MTRREFAKRGLSAISVYKLAASEAESEHQLQTIGVQLYTVRNIISDNPARVLKALDTIGYREAEVIWASMDKIWSALKQTQLRPVSIHMDSQLFKPENRSSLDAALGAIKERGFEYVVYPAVPRPERNSDLGYFENMAGVLGEVGSKCNQMGLQLCYHNHAFDFRPIGSTTPLEVLMTRTSPDVLRLEIDVFWVSIAGHDPVALLKKYSGRVPLVHLKNEAQKIAPQFNESVPPSQFRDVGSGVIDIAAVLRAARESGTKHFFVEQDQTPGDPIAALKASFNYLNKLTF